ncbi:MAG: DUF4365 domain-containing protein [bacterium]|nr:DUF4365 domain-containing protein [bacterium]
MAKEKKTDIKSTKKVDQVLLSSTIVKEDKSRNDFKNLLSPWICDDTRIDVGYDFNVQIIGSNDKDELRPEGRFFLVQLKFQTEIDEKGDYYLPYSIDTKKIIQWHNSSSQLPVLLAIQVKKESKFIYRWIDDALISELNSINQFWTSKPSHRIKIPKTNILTEKNKEIIKKYVFDFRFPFRKIIEPGVFFDLKERTIGLLSAYSELIAPVPFESVKSNSNKLIQDAENSLYRVTLTGLSRVGKSTLINTLLKKKGISPADVWQTTGVPIMIHPGKDEKVIVSFLDRDKKNLEFAYSPKKIKEYAARDYNEDNFKRVKDVSVYISSPQLERGVIFFDIPGLNDPNKEILDFAYYTADSSNVIIYIIDGSSARSGGFVFDYAYRDHIEKFSQTKKDKIFLVINKVDELSKDTLAGLKKEINKNLDKYDLRSKISEKIHYLAIDPKPENKKNLAGLKSEISTVADLEKDLWEYILNENKIGLWKLNAVLRDFYSASQQLEEIFQSRLLDTKNKKNLEAAIAAIRLKIPALEKHLHISYRKMKEALNSNLHIKKKGTIDYLYKKLRDIPLNQELPTDEKIKEYLIANAYRTTQHAQGQLSLEFNHLKDFIDSWITDNLTKVREIIKIKDRSNNIDTSSIDSLRMPNIDFSMTFGKTFLATVVGFLFNPLVGIGLGLGSFFMDLIFGDEHRRNKRIEKIISLSETAYEKAFANVLFDLENALKDQSDELIQYLNNKIKLYFKDIETQINSINHFPNYNIEVEDARISKGLDPLKKNAIQLLEEIIRYVPTTDLINVKTEK